MSFGIIHQFETTTVDSVPIPLRKHSNFNSWNSTRIVAVTNISILNDALDKKHKVLAARKVISRTRTQKIDNAKTNVPSLNVASANYVMFRTDPKKDLKLQPQWRGTTRVVEAKLDLVLIVENIIDSGRHTVHV